MKFRKIAVGLSVIALTNVGTPTIAVFANEVNKGDLKVERTQDSISNMKKFDIENNINFQQYKEKFKVKRAEIESVDSNGGNYGSSVPERAIDEDLKTHWESGKPNSDSFTNEFTVKFKDIVKVDKITYNVRQDSGTKGFLNNYEIYASKTLDGDDFTLVTRGTGKSTKDTVEIKFDEIEAKRIKVKFVEADGSWASISEIGFYKKDMVKDAIDNLFTNNEKNEVSSEYRDISKLNEIEDLAKIHPFYNEYKSTIEDAKTILESEKITSSEAIIDIFSAYNNENYNEIFKMDNSNIESVKNNAGNNMGKPISYATDGEINTAWESNKVNTDSFKNEVEIVFKEKILLDRVVYGARQNDSKGFAEEFEIYGSKTTNGETYELVSTGKYNPVKGLIEARFNPTEFKRMKFKFKKGKDNWATISEIAFYKEDEVSNKMKRLFTDSTLSKVSEEFNTIEKLEALEEQVKNHPLYDTYKESLENAKTLVQNDKVVATDAVINIFETYDNENYNEIFKMDNSNIESVKNNAGNNMGKPISYATDGDINTGWESNKVNTDSFKNEVEIVFKEKVLLDRVVYGARQNDSKGFAEEFEIYGSKTTNGETYELVSTGKYNPVKGLIEARFNPTEFKRMKFKFKKGKDNWATISEIAFYKEDKLDKTLKDIFNDGTMTSLKDEFNSKEAIDTLQIEVNKHPNKEHLQKTIDRAYSIINNESSIEKVKITVPQLGDLHGHAKNDLLMSSFGTNFISTGIVAKPGEVIEVYVEADKDSPLPQIVFSQSQGHYGKWRRNYNLKPGYNKFIVPEIFDDKWSHKTNKGGAIYLVNPYTSENQSKAPIVSIEGGQKFPVFNEGDDKAKFIEELKAYKEYMDENPESAVDIYEFNSERILFTGTASDAYQVYVNEGVDIEESINTWSSRFDDGFKFAGLEDNPGEPLHDSTNLRTSVRVMQPFGAAYAAGDHIGIQKHVADDFLRPDKKSVRGIAWGTMHEMGHQMDIRPRTWGEVTNNMWANDVYIKEGFGCKLDYNYVDKTVALNHNFEEQNGANLAMFWQLEAYKSGYWASLERMYRERKPNPKDYQEKKDILALYSSEIIGMNLTEYYERYGFNLSDNAKNELSKLSKLDKKIWYIHSNAIEYKGSGYNENLNVKINSRINEEARTNTLTFEMDEENKNAFLGYEISKNGVVIGFTRTNEFVVENIDINENAKYEVIPYDLKLNKGESITVDAFRPTIKSDEKITLEINEEFDLKKYVVAKTYKGELLNNIEVSHDIDISKAGIYNVEYSVVDNGIKSSTNAEVEVVSEYDYLSDFEWKSVNSQYGTPRRNSNIKVRKNGEIQDYEKGFGIHANGEIIYDLSDKDYDRFEAYVGVDMGIVAQNNSSVTFKISVDGKTVKTTNVLKHKDDAVYVNIPIKGAKELKIEVYDGGNGNSSDHAIIAQPKLTNNNAKPVLDIGNDNITIKIGTEYDLLADVVAKDIEDGNLIENIKVDNGGFNINKSGQYKITYSVSDSDNNTVTKTKYIMVYSDINYASDVEWESATTGWRTVNKDKAVGSNNKIKLNVDGYVTEFEKGIGVATNSEIVYNLEGKGYDYFSTYLGTDKNYNDNRTTIDFKILADGVEVYKSKTIKKDSKAEYVLLDIKDVKELKLIADDNDGSGLGDFASWADTKFYITNSKPKLMVEESLNIKVGESIENIIGEFSAEDIEDGDITSKVIVEGHENINLNKPGNYTITYTVTDSDDNTVAKERTITVTDMRDYKYLTDYNWSSATQSYGTTQKDKSVSNNTLRLTGENGEEVAYEKGIGSHANATIIYDLSDKEYTKFTSYVGVDRAMYNRPASVVFEVYVDGKKQFDSGLMLGTTPQKFVEVDIFNAKELKLVVKDGGNGNGSDHATWGDTKLHFVNIDRADLTNLREAIEKAEAIQGDNYSEESIKSLNIAINKAKELLDLDFVNEDQCKDAIKNIEDAISNLEGLDKIIAIEDKSLENDIKRTLDIHNREITLADMQNLVYLECKSGYVKNLKGLEYAVNLETLNIDFNEVDDISAIKNLKKLNNFSGKENFIMNASDKVLYEDGKFIIEDVVIGKDGQRLLPKEVVLSPRNNPINLDLNEVLVDNRVVIDSELIEALNSVEILYEDKINNYQLYIFSFLSVK